MPVVDSLRDESERTLRRREDRILSKMNTYRRNRNASCGLAILGALGVIGPLTAASAAPSSAQLSSTLSLALIVGISNMIIWASVCCACHARYQHAQSIAHCRDNHG